MPVYLSFFHGRNTPDEEMNDRGFTGPIVGPVHIAFIYGEAKIFKAKDGEYGSQWDEFKFIPVVEDLYLIDEKFYGEMEVWEENDPLLLEEKRKRERQFISWDNFIEPSETTHRLTDEL